MQRRITSLGLTDFRNYGKFSLEPQGGLTILVGPNGVGKTNIIEAISLVTRGESFRTTAWQDLVRWGSDGASVVMTAEDEGGGRTDIALHVAGGRRTYRVNGTVRRRVADVMGAVPAVVFTPEDLRIVKDSADRRRGALDSLGGQLSRSYAATRSEYERIVRQRNALLRSVDASESELEPWTERLLETGALLRTLRVRLLAALTADVTRVYSELSGGESLKPAYVDRDREPSGQPGEVREDDVAGCMRAAQHKRAREERTRGTSLVGPHRDDIAFMLEERDARAFASQGQQRTIALAWKLAEVDSIEKTVHATPVLLLDDVMSELDESRRQKLAAFVEERTQTFVTTTNLGYFDSDFVSAAKVVTLQ